MNLVDCLKRSGLTEAEKTEVRSVAVGKDREAKAATFIESKIEALDTERAEYVAVVEKHFKGLPEKDKLIEVKKATKEDKSKKGGKKDDVRKTEEWDTAEFIPGSTQKKRLARVVKGPKGDGTATAAPAITKSERALASIGNLFGLKTIFFKSDHPWVKSINGFAFPNILDEVYINSESNNPLAFTVGHETLHQLKANHPDLYDFLVQQVSINSEAFQKFKKEQIEARDDDATAIESDAEFVEEFLGDFTGTQFMDSVFWQKMSRANASFTERIIDVVKSILAKINKMAGSKYVNNFIESQDALVKAMSQYAERTTKASGKAGAVKLSKSDLREAGVTIKNGKAILYRGGDVSKSDLRKLRYGDYLSAVRTGTDKTGNAGASDYGKNVIRLELPISDIQVSNGELQYKGSSKSLSGGVKYPTQIYKAYNDYYGSNYTAEEIDKQGNVRIVASQALSGGREEFDALLKKHQTRDTKLSGSDQAGVVAPTGENIKFSLSTMDKWEKMATGAANKMGLDPKSVLKDIKKIKSVGNLLAQRPELLEKEGTLTPIRSNGDYIKTFDLNTNCPLRFSYQANIEAIEKELGRVMDSDELMGLSLLLERQGKTAPCIYCYVESARRVYRDMLMRYEGVRATVFEILEGDPATSIKDLSKWSGAAEGTMKMLKKEFLWNKEKGMTPPEFTTKLFANKAYQKAMERKDTRVVQLVRDAHKYAASASSANITKSFDPYAGQFYSQMKSKNRAKIMDRAGWRWFSSTDAQVNHIVDYMQAFTDLSVMGDTVHLYTKQPWFVEIFGRTNARINVSIAAYGGNGEVVTENINGGMAWRDAKGLTGKFKDVAGMMMATNDDQILWGLDQDWIDMVIPWHSSGMKVEQKDALGWTNYTSVQNERWITPSEHKGQSVPHFNYAQHKNNKKLYLRLCKEAGVKPRFDAFVEHPKYMKLVADTVRPDVPQEPIRPIFNWKRAKEVIKAWQAEDGYSLQQTADQKIVGGMLQLLKKDDPYWGALSNRFDELNTGPFAITKPEYNKPTELSMAPMEIPDTDTKFSKSGSKIKFSKNANSPEFKAWSKGYPILKGTDIRDAIPEKGVVAEVYHGTTNIIEAFDPEAKGTKEGYFGQVNYFTSSKADADQHYKGKGPDLERRIEDLAERLSDMDEAEAYQWAEDHNMDPDELDAAKDNIVALEQFASDYLAGPVEETMHMYVRLDNPVVIGGKRHETWIPVTDYDNTFEGIKEEYMAENNLTEDQFYEDEDHEDTVREMAYDALGEDANLIGEALIKAIQETVGYEQGNPVNLANKIWQETEIDIFDEVTASNLHDRLIASETLMDMMSEDGEIVSSHIAARVFKHLGYDSIILANADKTFPGMNMEPGTSHVHVFKETPSQMKSTISEFTEDPRIKFSKAPKALADKLESGEKVKVYRAMQIIDGKLYPPMSAKVNGAMREPTKIGQWEQADENPELAKNGKFKLDKANKSAIAARYNPYFHTSASPLNDQFSSAYKRPNLVTVEAEIPTSELTGGYKAKGAKDSVGEKQWNSGPVSSKLPADKKRTVILSRYAKVTRIVPDAEVAKNITKLLKGQNISVPDNVITPSLREELKKQGVDITESRYTKDIKFSKAPPVKSKAFKKWFGKSKVVDAAGNPLVVYHGTIQDFTEFDIEGSELGAHFGSGNAANAVIAPHEQPFLHDSIKPVYLSLQNPYDIVSDLGDWSDMGMLEEYLGEANDGPLTDEDFENLRDVNDVREALLQKGYDGIVYQNETEDTGSTSYIAFSPNQVKSVTGNIGTFDPNNPDIRFSKSKPNQSTEDFLNELAAKTTIVPTQRAAAQAPINPNLSASEQVFASKDTLKEKVSEFFNKSKSKEERSLARDRVVANTLDKLHFIKQRLGDRDYRIHRGLTGIQTASFPMWLQHGKFRWEGDVLTVDSKGEGVLPFLKSIGDDWQDLLKWTTVKRAEQLDKEGRENLITKPLRDEILKEVGETSKAGVRWSVLNTKLQSYNRNILDVAEAAGLINKESRAEWEQDFYIPFYRVFEDEMTRQEFLSGPKKVGQHITSQIKRLQGGTNKIGDPLENLMKNWMYMLDAAARNKARASAYKTGKALGILETVEKKDLVNILGAVTETKYAVVREGGTKARSIFDTKEEADNFISKNKNYKVELRKTQKIKFGSMRDLGVLSFQNNGKPVYFKTEDTDLFNAMLEVKPELFNNVLLKLMGKAKRTLSYTATFGAAFKIRNLIRDTVHVAVVSKNFKPVIDTAKGLMQALREDKMFIEFMASGYGFGSSYVDASDPGSAAIFVKKIIKSEGKSAVGNILDTPKKLLAVWEKLGSASENAARVALYTNLKAKGYSNLDAGFEARDLMDFSMSGGGTTTQLLIRTIPFLNARVQALYKLGRSAATDPKSFALKASMLTFASLALWSIGKDDDRYKELPDWDKWTYYHFWADDIHYRIPKPFEIGSLFSSLPETIANVQNGTDEGKKVWDWFKFTAYDVFSISPPQLFKPLTEQYFNTSTFTGQNIVPDYMLKLAPAEQYKPWTPDSAKMLGEALGMSPLRIEHLIRGYLATIGMGVLSGMDIMSQNIMGYPEGPASTIDDYGMGFIKRGAPARSTKYIASFYELYREMDSLNRTVNHYKQTGQHAKIEDIRADERNQKLLRLKRYGNSTNKRMSDINRRIKIIYRSDMTPAKKRTLIDNLTKRKNKLAEDAVKRIKR